MKKIGFIGIGIMGGPIVQHLLKNNYEVYGYTRTKQKATKQLEQGMHWCENKEILLAKADIIFTMVGFPSEVEELYLASDGLLAQASPGKIFIDLTTSTPALASRLAQIAREKGCFCLDAPVTGGDLGAKNGTLAMMVGGDAEIYEQITPILQIFTGIIAHFGVAGNGQHAKMANQLAIAGNLLGMAESLSYAQTVGINPQKILDIMASGSASSWQLVNNGPKALAGDLNPGFFIKHFSKDLHIALETAASFGQTFEGLELVLGYYDALIADGYGDSGTQALLQKIKEKKQN